MSELARVDWPADWRRPVRSAEVVSIGTELMQGLTVNTNATWISAEMVRLGIPVVRHVALADEMSPAVEVLKESAGRADLVIVTGGLGPTRDDITREVIARAAGVPLVLDEQALGFIEDIFRKRIRRPMTENNRLQAYLPEGGFVLSNPVGTAPGIACRVGGARVFAFPGVPRELKAMFGHVERFVEGLDRSGRQALVIRRLMCFGTGESDLGQRLADLMDEADNPTVSMTVDDSIITVKLTARAGTREVAQGLITAREAEVCRRVGQFVYGVDGQTLAEVTGRTLLEKKMTLATAESCTGGWLAQALTEVSGISRVFVEGAVTYSNESKVRRLAVPTEMIARHGAVSEEVAGAMARGIRAAAGTDIGVGITGIAGPGGGTPEKPVGLVYIALDAETGTEVRKHMLFGDRQMIRRRAALWALDGIIRMTNAK